MENALQDRPARTSSVAPSPGRRRSRGAALLGGAVLVGVLAVAGADRALDLLPSWDDPLQEQVIDRERPALVLALADLAEYHAAEGTFQVVVDLEKDAPYLPGFVKGERTTYLAVGTVDGLVDFRDLSADAVRTEGDAVTFVLPAPTLDDADVDLERSRVVARDRGVLDRIGGAFSDDPTSEREVALLAERKLDEAALSSDLLRRSQDNTRAMLTGLARSLGYTDVTVRFDGDPGT